MNKALVTTLPSAVVLIDGSNVYHAFKSARGRAMTAQEYELVIRQVSQRFEVREVRFYDAKKDLHREPEGYNRQQSFHYKLRSLTPPIHTFTRPLVYAINLTRDQVEKEGKRIGIKEACRKLLYTLLQNLNLIRTAREKGIDVLLVVDAVEAARQKKAEWVVFVTGDADFVPAVHLVHQLGTKTLNLHTFRGSATELRRACTSHAVLHPNQTPYIQWFG